ncbi:hypothetical protein K0U91_05340 [Chryseobacterium chendengshani]|uniref:hypothetical protein n=1 Tax=Chryseobacterium sp. LJ668 TaxID=2864040 RepID=UPI001C691FA7|nr:hypothetical protein [Chryseobacterium sp. LJ668]MBW8521891.1 hypothetical protein [Chryseobacterium sp. LJ668]QYK17550.1 hypothetical protein K0U91_05340 [Chryseobacterium sp. LJ668]
MKIILKDWKTGFEKVTLTKLQINILGISLRDAEFNVDSILNGDEVILNVEDEFLAQKFIEKISEIRVNFQIFEIT